VKPPKVVEEDSDSEEEPDLEISIPDHKVKLVIGAGGTKIQEIQKKSKCRIQVGVAAAGVCPAVCCSDGRGVCRPVRCCRCVSGCVVF
jgi:hypothetical protein